ncbi:MAG: autotransporter-associated beta strand repeat-containing protein, partial [Prevotella sp.]|nr:autotransporter-associated beta strand repeat-containing protein [Prevotella sp.]
IVAYDWDQDGKAEALMRAADGTTIHMADGTTQVIGDKSKNYRASSSSGQWFIHDGAEYLVYMNGETGKPYQVMDYPLTRESASAWGDDYGHRSSKYFFGAPYLDGRKPSIFLGRGIYTRHKFIAMDVDPNTHQLSERWRWNCNNSTSPWYGNGYHNFGVADVDWDGRDEIVWGSMVIDDNGRGLSTTGYGHGDSQHCGDFDPYTHGQEIFACLEDAPTWGNNFRDATTSKVYYKHTGNRDDGRALMANVTNDFPGALGISSTDDNAISSVTYGGVRAKEGIVMTQNFRIYWDGDLLEETQDYAGSKDTEVRIYKYGQGIIETLTGSMTNNDTKGTPCYQGDVLGDWREEVITRTSNNRIRIYTTTIPTEWRNYTLWHDTQYRNAMVWQMCGYNQTPHTSYFLGEVEGITMAPPALTMTDRTEVKNGGSIGSSTNDQQVVLCETGNAMVSVSNGASPYIFFDNAPSWVQGTDVDGTSGKDAEIEYDYYTHTLTGGAFGGSMRLVKQGDGALTLPNVTQTYSGPTDVWAGVLNFDGTMQNSRVWLNRFAELNSDGGKFPKSIQMDYAAILRPGGADKQGTVETDSLIMNFGSRLVMDVYSDGTADKLTANVLKIEKKDWENGPKYNSPVVEIVQHASGSSAIIPAGKYLLVEVNKIVGNIEDVVLEGSDGLKASLSYESGKLYFVVDNLRDAVDVEWDGVNAGIWDFYNTKNFKLEGGELNSFVTGDIVHFGDAASNTNVVVNEDVYPGAVVFDNSKSYTLSGEGAISGDASLTKNGSGEVKIQNVNKLTGDIMLNDGKLTVSSLADAEGADYGALGGINQKITMNGGTLVPSGSLGTSQQIVMASKGGSLEVPQSATMTLKGGVVRQNANVKSALHKKGAGALTLGTGNSFAALYVDEGAVNIMESANIMSVPDTIVFNGYNVSVYDENNAYSYSKNSVNYKVTEGSVGNLYLDGRCEYLGGLYGKGTLNVYAQYVRGELKGNWSEFEGTVVCNQNGQDFRWFNSYGLPKGTMHIPSGSTVNAESRSFSLGNLTGGGTLSTSGTVTIGSLNEDFKFTGSFNNTKVVKVGSGSWTFTKSVSGASSLAFRGGDIILNNTGSTLLFGSSMATVENEAVVKGIGTIAALTVQNGGKLMPGSATSSRRYGAITSTGSINLYNGSTLQLIAYNNKNGNTSRSYLTVGGDLNLSGEITIELGYTPAAGDELIFWTAKNVKGTPTAINLPELPAGLYWDTSELLKPEGKLIVTDQKPTGIRSIRTNGMNDGKIYTLDGKRVEMPLKEGIYIKNGKKFYVK